MDLTTLLTVLLPLAFIIYWLVDLEKDVTNKNWNGVLTKASAFVAAFAVVSLYAHSSIDLGAGAVARAQLSRLNWSDLALVALAIAAGGGGFADYLRARNASDGSVTPLLLPKLAPPVVLKQPTDQAA